MRITSLTVALAGLLLAGSSAHAALQITYSFDSGATTFTCGGVGPLTALCAPLTDGNVTVTNLSAFSNTPGLANLAQEFGSALNIVNTAAGTFDVWIVSQDFMKPVGASINFLSSIGTTATVGTGTISLSSCVDTSNLLYPPFCSAGTLLVNAPLAYVPGANSNSTTTTIASLASPFALSQHISIVLNAGSSINLSSSAVLTPTAVPEPMSIVLLGGIVLLTSGLIRRKRNQPSNV